MKLNELIKALEVIKKGTFVRIVYDTELPSTALARSCGVKITKRTEKVVRLGVNYHNIAEVKKLEAERTEPKRQTTSWCHWEIPNIIAKHNTKDDYYLSFATVKYGSHTRSKYYINGDEATYTMVAEGPFVQQSYFKSSNGFTPIQKIKVENIVELGGSRG